MNLSEIVNRRKIDKVTSYGIDVSVFPKVLKQLVSKRTSYIEEEIKLRVSKLYDICPRFEVFRGILLKGKGRQPYEDKSKLNSVLMMEIGTHLHSFFQNDLLGNSGLLKGNWVCKACGDLIEKDCYYFGEIYDCEKCFQSGRLVYSEYFVYNEDRHVGGHLDGIVCLNRLKKKLENPSISEKDLDDTEEDTAILEIKSTGEDSFNEIVKDPVNKLPIYYRWQASEYQRQALEKGLIKKPVTLFLYIDRKYLTMASFSYCKESNIIDEIDKKLALIVEGIEKGIPPNEGKKCLVATCERAKDCYFKKNCFELGV